MSEDVREMNEHHSQHEADQHDGVFKLIETHLSDQPWPQPTDQRFWWLAGLPRLHFKMSAS
jgi:hypothetical protein